MDLELTSVLAGIGFAILAYVALKALGWLQNRKVMAATYEYYFGRRRAKYDWQPIESRLLELERWSVEDMSSRNELARRQFELGRAVRAAEYYHGCLVLGLLYDLSKYLTDDGLRLYRQSYGANIGQASVAQIA